MKSKKRLNTKENILLFLDNTFSYIFKLFLKLINFLGKFILYIFKGIGYVLGFIIFLLVIDLYLFNIFEYSLSSPNRLDYLPTDLFLENFTYPDFVYNRDIDENLINECLRVANNEYNGILLPYLRAGDIASCKKNSNDEIEVEYWK